MPPIRSRAHGEAAPLSFAQERLWFLAQLEPQSTAYNICRASRLLGNLSSPVLEASLREIVNRHETLRTAFRLIDGKPVQLIRAAEGISIDFVDLRSVQESERKSTIQRQIETEALRPFNLESGALLRCALLRVAQQEHILVLTTHHSAADAWSMGTLTRELWTLYDAFSNGRPSPLQPLPVQYSDYAVWQRDWLQENLLESQLGYWKERLKDLPVLNLPTDRLRQPHQSFYGARVTIELPDELTSAVNEMSHRFAVTPFMILLAAFQVLLYRYTGQEDVVVGSPTANRRRPEVEGLIGFFVNTLVLRADLTGKPSFTELLFHVRDVCVGANANQDLPFEKLVQELQPERDKSRNPLFQVMFVLQNATRPFSGIPGLRVEPLEVATTRSPFDLSLFLRERDGKYVGNLEYSTDLFDHGRIERMACHFQTLLEVIVKAPDQSIARLPILTEGERHRILVEWNDTATDYPKDKCIHQLFEEQVERTPEATAVEFEDQQITYRELNRRANQLAHYLISLGIGPEKLVGICIERSIEMVVGLLGILKAGGSYVPLDPAYPQERLRFMLENSQVSVLLTKQKLVEDREWRIDDEDSRSSIFDPRVEIVCLDRDSPKIEQQSSKNPIASVSSSRLAYVIYTSGSAGRPKGVQIEHRSVVNCLIAIGKQIDLRSQDKWLAVTTISFDIAAPELFLPLITGAKLVLTNSEESGDTTKLVARLKTSQANVMQATPSMWQLLFETGWQCPTGFTILSGGEALRCGLADRFWKAADSVWNLYGPTESTIWSTMARVRANESLVSIGRPIANTQVYILDPNLQPVPIGVPGELYIGGDGLARGYLNYPELISEKFLSDPFKEDPHSRLYRTGDLAKYRADGNIEFLGRCDNQVKIRGHRIELGEIETILNQHPSVKEALVVTRARDELDEKDLAAYVVSDHKLTPTIADLRGFLRKRVPEFMVPSVFMFLDVLPLTPNGKIDCDALPPFHGERTEVDHGCVEPRTEIEELVAQIWREVLKRDEIGIYDNFFDLGGHSLLATRVIVNLQEAFNKDVPLGVLFDAPTIAELAVELEKIIRHGHAPELPPIVPSPRSGPLPLSLNQEHLWQLDRLIPGTRFFNMPYAYRLTGALNVGALEKALKKIIGRHEALRTVFNEIDGCPVQIIKNGLSFQLETLDFRGGSPADVSRAAAEHIVEERSVSFDLVTGPLLRVKLLRLTEREALLLMTMHHIISDHWSMQLFREELIEIYGAEAQGCQSSLPQPKIQWGDYALWERRLLDTGQFIDQARYWNTQVFRDDCKDELRVTAEADNEIVHQFYQQTVDIKASLLDRLRRFAVQQNCTPFVVVLSAIFVTVHLIFGELEIFCGTMMSNRRRREFQGAIGHFLNTVVVRTRLSPHDTFERIVKKVRAATLAAHANQEFPFEQLRRDIQSRPGKTSSIRVLVNYQKRTFPASNLAGLTFAPYPLPSTGAESNLLPAAYDLIFDVKEMSTKLIATVNVVADICNQREARNANARLAEILNIMVSEPSKSLLNLATAD